MPFIALSFSPAAVGRLVTYVLKKKWMNKTKYELRSPHPNSAAFSVPAQSAASGTKDGKRGR